MLKTRIDQDALHRTSGSRLELARETKKECARIRKELPKYLRGHLFRRQARRIGRHLAACPVCASELHSMRHAADTRQLLKDLTPLEGMAARLESTLALLGGLRLLLYRPLWIILTALIAGYLYFFVIVPFHRDPELESIERSLPAAVVSNPEPSHSAQNPVPDAASAPPGPAAPAAAAAVAKKAPDSVSAAPAAEPLAITITPDDQSSMKRINDIMKGHAGLRKLHFTDTVREVSGSLTPGELQTLFGRIEQAGRVSYSKKRFNALSTAELAPFVMKLKDAPRAAAKPVPAVSAVPSEPAAALPRPVASSPTPSAQP